MTSLNDKLDQTINERENEFYEISMQIHNHPETAYKEVQAHAFLTNWLEKEGWSVKRSAFGLETAFVAEFRQGEGRSVSFNAEYDALPEIGHACGHNLICMASMAAATSIKLALDQKVLNGRVLLFGTPAEEFYGGKIKMLEAGAYDQAGVSLMVHPRRTLQSANMSTLAVFCLNVEYKGISSHAAMSPHEAKNALDAFVLAYQNISALRQQLLPTDRVHGVILEGGKAANIIPNYTLSQWILRSTTHSQLKLLRDKAVACFEAAALATGTSLNITWLMNYVNMIPNQALREEFTKVATDRFSLTLTNVDGESGIDFASTDQGNVSHVIPSLHSLYAINGEENNHSTGFAAQAKTREAHIATLTQAKILAATAARYLQDDEFAARVKSSFEDQKQAMQ